MCDLTEDQNSKLVLTELATPWDPLKVLFVDSSEEFGKSCSQAVDFVNSSDSTIGIVVLHHTKLKGDTPRRETIWPRYKLLRNDGLGDGIIVHIQMGHKYEELHGMPRDVDGLWLTMYGGAVDGGEKVSIVGLVIVDSITEGELIMDYISKCKSIINSKYTDGYEIIIYVNSDLKANFDLSPQVDLSFTRPAPHVSLLCSEEGIRSRSVCSGGILVTSRSLGCPLCSIGFSTHDELKSHRETNIHKKNFLNKFYQKHKDDLLVSPHKLGLEMSVTSAEEGVELICQGVVQVRLTQCEPKSFKLQLKNTLRPDEEGNGDKGIVIESVGALHDGDVVVLSDEHNLTAEEDTKIRVKPGKRYKVDVTCRNSKIGQLRVPIIAAFYDETSATAAEDSQRLNHMALELLIKVQNEEIVAMLPVVPFRRTVKYSPWFIRETVKGKAPFCIEIQDNLMVKLPIGNHPISQVRSKIIAMKLEGVGETAEEVGELIMCKDLMEQCLSMDNYQDKFGFLLHCEQWQEERDVRFFDMNGVALVVERSSGLVVLEVSGLQEGRPSVLRGDKLFARVAENGTVKYEGIVHKVGDKKVWIGFSDKLVNKLRGNTMWDIRFSVSTFTSDNMHRAIKLANSFKLTQYLFPTTSLFPPFSSEVQLEFFDKKVQSNPEQLAAVMSIVAGQSGPAPYLVFGPPGTGKTVTLVEAIKQVWKLSRDAHILATAPSNTAADILASRLARDLPHTNILRMHASSRSHESIPENLLPISNVTEGGGYRFQPMTELSKFKIIVTTLVTAGKLVSAMFPPDHFQHVFIDEAAQATEPETCVALAGIINSANSQSFQIVMAGDPMQLGPIIRSSIAEKYGLTISLMERLMSSPPYAITDKGYDRRCITKLTRNFRSHPSLLTLPAKMFYGNEIVSCADSTLVNSCLNFSGLTDASRGKIPFLVHGIIGQDLREETSPSFFNPEEVYVVMDYVVKVLGSKDIDVMPEDIGIITPYNKQVQKIRARLDSRDLRGITVGTTEEFQGQERKVMILSTVRSSPEYVNLDHQYRLGFLAESKRFNVAITRAQALLIVIGNPYILYQDKDWRQLLQHANSLGCFTGCSFPEYSDEAVEVVKNKMAKLMLDKEVLKKVEDMGWGSQDS